MAIKHAIHRAAQAFGESIKSLGEGAAALATSKEKRVTRKEASDSTIGYTCRFIRNVFASTVSDVPVVSSLSDWFIRHKDVERIANLAPEKMYAKLDEYAESYDLKKFKTLSETAIESIHTSASHIIGNQEALDVSTIDTLSKAIDNSNQNNNPAAANTRKEALKTVNEALAKCIPTTKLGHVQEKFHDIKRAIEKGENPTDPKLAADTTIAPIYSPYEAAEAFKNIYTVAQKELKKEHEKALEELKKLFADTVIPSEFKKKLASLFGLPDTSTPAEINAIVSKHKDKIIDEVAKSYKKAEDELKEKFEGKPATKDKDGKDIDAVPGVNEHAHIAANASKFDLLSRINAFERLLKRDPNLTLPTQEFTGTTGANDPMMDPATKKRCLRGLSRKEINKLEKAGWFGKQASESGRTSDGTELMIREEDGELQVGLKVPGLWFPYHKATPQQLLKDMLEATDIILAEGDVPPKITWQIDAKTDELREKMVIAACLAAHARGVDPKHITLTASGSQQDEKKNFSKKNATDQEVMQILSASGSDEVKKMLSEWKKEEKAIQKKYTSTQEFIKGGVNALREQKTVANAKELNKDDGSTPTMRGPGTATST